MKVNSGNKTEPWKIDGWSNRKQWEHPGLNTIGVESDRKTTGGSQSEMETDEGKAQAEEDVVISNSCAEEQADRWQTNLTNT